MSEPVKPFVFVIMPFDKKWADIYKFGIQQACEAVGAACERVDEQMFTENILERIYGQIRRATFVIAEMTGRNANVFYEAGYAHGVGKPLIFLTQSTDDIPFDLQHYPHIVYGTIAELRDELEKKMRWCVEHPAEVVGLTSKQNLPPELESMAKQIENYLRANDYTKLSFDRIQSLHPTYTRVLAEKLLVLAPDRFRPAFLKGNKPGIALVVTE